MPTPQDALYPLELEPIYKTKVWGGRRLERLGRALPGGRDTPIGESWELADLAASSKSGGGGGEERSRLANGPLAGLTLHEAWSRLGSKLFPRVGSEPQDFPLLVKYLDAQQNLSLQVHPSESFARAHPEAVLKSEAWYVIEAEPGAVLYKGVRPGVDAQSLRRALSAGDATELRSLLIQVPAHAGDVHYLPSGTLHALGAGVLVAEVQNPSDTTFRVFDWGRTDRELHVEQAMQCIQFGPCNASRFERKSESARDGVRRRELVECAEFSLARIDVDSDRESLRNQVDPAVWMLLSGHGSLTGDGFEPVEMRPGQTLFLPAALGDLRVRASAGTSWLEIGFPSIRS
jgi:mannose-6-phosphate isomerase